MTGGGSGPRAMRLARGQRHHHVGGAVGLEEIVDVHDRAGAELAQRLGLVEEALAAPGELARKLC